LDDSNPALAVVTCARREGRCHMVREAIVAVLCAAALGLGLAASPVPAQVPPDNAAALACQVGANRWLGKVVLGLSTCSRKCFRSKQRSTGPYYGCDGNYYLDPSMNRCVSGTSTDPGVLLKAAAGIARECSGSCPACYQGTAGNCPDGSSLISLASGYTLGGLIPSVYCNEESGGTPTKAEAPCEHRAAASLAKYVTAKQLCYAACVQAEFLGKIPAGSCLIQSSGGPADAATAGCIARARRKVTARIEGRCAAASAIPSCWGHDGTL